MDQQSYERAATVGLLVHPTPSLTVGQRLTGKLISTDGNSFVFPSPVDASLVFEITLRRVRPATLKVPSGEESQSVIFPANPKLVARARQLRADVAEAETKGVSEKGSSLARQDVIGLHAVRKELKTPAASPGASEGTQAGTSATADSAGDSPSIEVP